MSHKELNEALEIVRRELSSNEQLDPTDVARLRSTMEQIETALQHQPQNSESLSENVTSAASSFEQSHPRLTETLGQIADMLQQMGI
ncbi:DUF4404 family protein [Rubripirellula reticaptiva]|uniref:DUF4404 domain-containing protein n=1 Tax=Rubripirellula reticaptiva TaxID=2528013 RepID=A0A5C6F7Y5_9BACT|nr:DUF4404 family protein [Rubripirellula reticaptiva]TWU57843.1 hypothetical protein Poly59_07520 [Rubripirellula reticaptiva]